MLRTEGSAAAVLACFDVVLLALNQGRSLYVLRPAPQTEQRRNRHSMAASSAAFQHITIAYQNGMFWQLRVGMKGSGSRVLGRWH